jgi:hypothetical protein
MHSAGRLLLIFIISPAGLHPARRWQVPAASNVECGVQPQGLGWGGSLKKAAALRHLAK